MLDHGRPEDVNLKDKHGYSALHCGTKYTHEIGGVCGFTFLLFVLSHLATYESVNEAVLMLLLRFPKIDCTLQNISDNTPLHYFCSNYTDPNVDHILDIFRQKHAQIDAVNQFGETPLHRAVLNRKPMAMVQGLLARQANVNAQTKKLHTPLHYCVNREGADPAVVDLLLRSGASPLLRDSQNITPADAARASGQIQIANRLLNAERVALWLAQIGMSQYLNNFMAQEMLYEVLGDIKAPTLAAMGVTLTGHVMKIMRAVRQLKRAERANDMRKPKKRRSLSASTKVAGGKPTSRGSKLGELSHTGNDDAVAGANNNNNNDDDGDDDGDENGDENGDDDDDDDDDEAAGGVTENDTTATASTNASNASAIAAAGAAGGATASSSADAATSVVAAMANNGGEPRLDNNYVDAGKSGLSTTLTNAIPFAASTSLQEQVRGLLAAHPERSCRLVPTDALQIGAPLGQGVSAFVFRGRLLQRRVAIKVFTLAADDTATEQTKQEARVRVENDCLNELSALLALRSPFIVVCRAVTLEPQLSLVLAEHARRSMYHVLHEPEYKLRWRVLLNWASDAAGAVSCMHQHTPPFVHRDLKSLNFLVTDEDGVRLCDFGCARRVVDDNDEELTELKGTAFYAAPEVYFGEAFEKASDVYSLGICFWELVASLIAGVYVRPFSEYNDNAFDFHVFARAAQKHMRPTLSSECPDVMLELVASMLAPTAARRPTAIDIIETLNKATLEYERLRDIWERLEGIGAGQHVPGAPCRPADDIGPPRDNSSTTSKPSTTNTASATPLNVSTPTIEKPGRHERLANELGLSPRPPEAVAVATAESSSGVRAILSPRDAAAAAAAATASSSSLASSSGSVASSSASSSRPTKPRRRKVRNARTLDRSGTTGSASLREAKHMAVTAEAARSAPDLAQQKKRRTLRATRAEPTSPKSPKSPEVLSLTSGGVPRYSDAVRSVHAKVVQRRASDDQLSSDLSSSPKPSHQSLAKTLASVVTRGRGDMMAGLTKSQTREVDDSSDSGDKHLTKLTTADVLPSAIALELLDLDDGSAEFGSAVGRSGRIDQVRKLVFGTTDASDTSDGMRDASDDEPEPTVVADEAQKAAPEQPSIEESSTDDDLSHGHNGQDDDDDDDHAGDAPSVVSSSSSKRRPATVASGSRTSARPALKVDRSMSLRVTTSEAAELGAAAATAVANASAATSQAPDVHSVFKEKRSTELTTTSRSPPPNKGRASGAAAVLAARQRLLRTPSPQPPGAAPATVTTTTTTTTTNDRQQKVKSMVSTIEQQIAPSVAPVLVKRTTSEQQLSVVVEKTEEIVH
jgi:serine/threonine protein kinase